MVLDYDTATGTMIITLAGELDVSNKQVILDQVASVLPLYGLEDVALDMSEVTLLDTAALGAMISAQRICRSQGKRLLVRHPSRCVERVLRATFTDPLFSAGPDDARSRG